MYNVKAKFYANRNQSGESYVLTSDNEEKDLELEVGQKVKIQVFCTMCGNEISKGSTCMECYRNLQ